MILKKSQLVIFSQFVINFNRWENDKSNSVSEEHFSPRTISFWQKKFYSVA